MSSKKSGYSKKQNEIKSGGNGNVVIDEETHIATKRLKLSKYGESKQRFLLEMQVLKAIKDKRIPGIVEIIEVDDKNEAIKMRAYVGNLEMVYDKTKGNVKQTFSLLLPIVYALKALAEFATPIYHRDIKPQNILVDDSAEELRLVLADFGCAYMEESDKRITDDFRAVGAQLYRAPEYQYGRVEDVDEKGDIFSIGKLIWNMINGNKAEVFPYTLWFPKEYNLSVRFPNTVELRRANNLIAACVNYDKSKRPTYQQLIEEMEDILSSNNSKDDKSEMIQKAREFEARRVLVNAGNCEKAVFLLASYLSDFRGALCNFTDFKLEFVRKMESRHYALPTEVQMDVLQALVERNTEFKLLSMELQGVYYQTSYRPSTDATALLNIPGVVRELPCLYTFYGGGHVKRSDMSIFFINGILHYKNEAGKIEKYTGKVWTEYLEEFIRRYVQ